MRTVSVSSLHFVDNESTASSTNRCRRIVLMGIDMYETDNDSYFWNSVRALGDLGHNIIIIRNRGMSKREVRQINFPHMKIGTWIPRTICGYFRSVMYVIRSAYTAIWVVRNLRATIAEFEPTLVVSDASCIAVPILHTLGSYQVVCLEYFRELLAEFEPFCQNNSLMEQRFVEPIRRKCLAPAELIVVPCQNARQQLVDTEDERVSVMYPPAEGEHSSRYEAERMHQRLGHGPAPGYMYHYHQHLHHHHHYRHHMQPTHPLEYSVSGRYSFIAVGAYEPHSNFHVLIDAFETLLETVDVVQRRRLSLTVVGSLVTNAQRAYRRELRRQLVGCSATVAAQVTLHTNLAFEERCALYRASCAVLNANVDDLYVPSLIEAFYFGCLVITADSDFATEVLRDAVTGLVVSQLDADAFVEVISDMVHHEGPTYRFIAMAGSFEYDDVYSFQSFTDRLQQFILSLSHSHIMLPPDTDDDDDDL